MSSVNSLNLRSPEYQLPQSQPSANLSRSESEQAFNTTIKRSVESAAVQYETMDLRTLRAAGASSGASESMQGQASLKPVGPPMIKRKPVLINIISIIEVHIKMGDYAAALSLATDTLAYRRNLYRKEDEQCNEILALKIRTLLLQDEYDEAEAYYESMPSASIFHSDLKHFFNGQETGTVGLASRGFENESRNSIPDLPEPVPQDSMSVPPLQGSTIIDSQLPGVYEAWKSVIQTLTGHSGGVNAVEFSPDGKQIASASWDKTIKLWDATIGDIYKTLTGHSGDVDAVAFSPDGKQIASASDDKTIKLWNATTSNLYKTLTGHSGGVNAVEFSPDGKQIASASDDKTIKLWDATTGNL